MEENLRFHFSKMYFEIVGLLYLSIKKTVDVLHHLTSVDFSQIIKLNSVFKSLVSSKILKIFSYWKQKLSRLEHLDAV